MVRPLGRLLAVAALAAWCAPASALEYVFKADANVLDVWKAPPGVVEELGKGVRVETADGAVTLATDKANLFLYHPGRVADGTVELAARAQWPNPFGLLGRYNPATTDGILALVDPGAKKVVLARLDKGKRLPLAEAPLTVDPQQAFTLTLRLEGAKATVSINGVEQASADAADAPAEGVAGLFGQWYTRLRPAAFRVAPLAAASGSAPARTSDGALWRYRFEPDGKPLETWKAPAYFAEALKTGKIKFDTLDGRVALCTGEANALLYAGPADRADYAVEVVGRLLWDNAFSLIGRFDPAANRYYSVAVEPKGHRLILNRHNGAAVAELARAPLPPESLKQPFRLRLVLDGKRLSVSWNGTAVIDHEDVAPLAGPGCVGLAGRYYLRVGLDEVTMTAARPAGAAPVAAVGEPPPLYTVSSAPPLDAARRVDYDLAKAWRRTDGMRLALSLNHLWEFIPADKASGPPPEAGSPHGLMMVPGHWRGGEVTNFVRATDGAAIAVWKGRPVRDWPSAYYARTFTLPPERRGDVVVLHIESIKGTPGVFLNGKKIHAGDSDDNVLWLPLEDGLNRDGENRLVIGVDGATSPTYRCGLFGNAWLRLAPAHHIGEPRIVSDLAGRRLLVELPGRSPMEVKVDVALTLPGRKPGDAPLWTARTMVGRANTFIVPWPEGFTPELWTPDTPTLYEAHFAVDDAVGGTVDRFTRRFGFREFRVEKGRYWLNGKPVVLKLDTALANEWSPDWLLNPMAARRQMEALKRANLNGMYVGHYAPDAVYDLADEMGVFLIRWGLMPGHAALDHMDEAGMTRLETAVARLAANPALANHPSLIGVLVDVWYNFHAGTTNPQFVGRADAVRERRTLDADGRVMTAEGGDPNLSGIPAIKKRRLEAIAALYQKHLPGLVCFTGGSGEVGPVYATHIYHTWGAPLAELRAFFERYRLQRERALFVGETTLPYVGAFYDLANFHGGGKSCMTENTVRFHGPRGYTLDSTLTERPFHEKQPGGFFLNRQETVGQRRYGFKPDAYTSLVEAYLSATMVPWRYSGLNGVGAFGYVLGDHHAFASKPVAADAFRMPDDLSLPGYKPEALPWSNAVAPTYEPFGGEPDFRPTPLASELKRVMADVALFIGGDERDVFLQDHAYTEGESLRRVVALVNDAPREVTGTLTVSLLDDGGGQVHEVRRSVTVPASGDATAVFEVPLPVAGERREWRLRATFEGAVAARDEIELETFPAEGLSILRPGLYGHAEASVRIGQNPLYLFDPEGVLAAKLTAAGVGFVPLSSLEKPPADGVVVVGRDGLRRGTAKFDPVAAADAGVFCLLLEQSAEASPELMKARQREAFINDPRHPALAGFRDRDFRYWRGSHGPSPAFEQNGANHNWADNGNRNLLASHVFRRPAHGNYQALLVSGFDLFQTPLLEYRSARGGWIASQLELTDRLDVDPVATRLFNRLVRYLDLKVGTRPPGGVAVFAGDAGRSWLRQFGVTAEPLAELSPGTLAGIATLLVAAPDFGRLERARGAVNDFVCAGGTVVYLQVGGDFSPSWLPFPATLAVREGLRQAVARPDAAERSGPGSLFMRGWGNSELYFRDPFDVPVWDNLPSRAAVTEPAVVAEMPAGRGRFVLVGVTPERFGDHPAAGKTARLLSSLLTAAGVPLADESRPFALREPARALDLSELKWEFALDERDVGLKENWHKGEGGGTFLKGLIRDGVEVRVGQPFESFLGREYDGVAWYRIELDVPPELAGERELYFIAGAIDDFDETWLNGVAIGATGRETPKWWEAERVYPIVPGLLRPGKNLLAIRVVDDKGVGGLVKPPLAIANRRPSTPQGWKTPYPGGSARDYEYKPDIVRQY